MQQQQLLAEDAPPAELPDDSDRRTALCSAAERGHAGIVQLLASAKALVTGAPTGRTALAAAAGRVHFEVARGLLQAQASVNLAEGDADVVLDARTLLSVRGSHRRRAAFCCRPMP